MTLGVRRAARGEATLKNGSGSLFEPLIYHGSSGKERPSAVEQLSNRVVWPDGSRNAALSTELHNWWIVAKPETIQKRASRKFDG